MDLEVFVMASNIRLKTDLRPGRCARRSRPLSLGVRQKTRCAVCFIQRGFYEKRVYGDH